MLSRNDDRARRMAAVALAVFMTAPALAQSGASGGGEGAGGAGGATSAGATVPYWAAVNANNVFVRSGPSVQSSYAFGRLASGDVVEVLEESYGWARVRCTGPAFESIHGYVPADRRVELSADGATLKVTAKSEVKAANIGSKGSPDASWKPIAKLAAGDVLTVLGTQEGEREKVYTVALPASAEGFVNLNYLRRASAAEVEAAKSPRAPAGSGAGAASAVASKPTLKVQPVSSKPQGGVNAPSGESASAARAGAGSASSGTLPNAAGSADAPAADGGATIDVVEATITENPDGSVVVTGSELVVSTPKRDEEAPATRASIESAANRAEFADLESIWEAVKLEPLADAELGVLRERYAELVTRPNVAGDIRQMSKARMEQLGIKLAVQERMMTLERLREQRGQDLDRIRAIAIALEARSDYDAVGILNASTVFDGKRLPALYRLQDPAVGQVIAYVAPKEDFELATMLGVLVGMRGDKRYDEALRVNVIEPRTVDILTQRRDPQVIDPNAPTGATQGTVGSATSSGSVSDSSATPTPDSSTVRYAPVPPDAP